MSDLQETPRFRPSDRKRRTTTTCEVNDRFPTPYPKKLDKDHHHPKITNIESNSSHPPTQKAATTTIYGKSGLIALQQYSSSSSPIAATAADVSIEGLNDNPLEILKSNINRMFDGIIERMVAKIEEQRKKYLNEWIGEGYGDEQNDAENDGDGGTQGVGAKKDSETFEDEIESQTGDEDDEDMESETTVTDDSESEEEGEKKDSNFVDDLSFEA